MRSSLVLIHYIISIQHSEYKPIVDGYECPVCHEKRKRMPTHIGLQHLTNKPIRVEVTKGLNPNLLATPFFNCFMVV